MFYINYLSLIFLERHLNWKMIILTSFYVHGILTSYSISQQCAYSNADTVTTIQDSCMNFSAFVQHSLMYRMYVKSEKQIFSWLYMVLMWQE